MIVRVVFGGLAVALAAANAHAAERPPVILRAEACLRENVARVAATGADVAAAADFLVSYACAREVGAATRYERNSAWLASLRAMMTARPGALPADQDPEITATVNPETGEFVIPPPKPGSKPNMFMSMLPQMSTSSTMMVGETPSAELRQLAGELVLRAHETRRRP